MELIEKTGELREALLEMKKDLSGRLAIAASTIPGVYLLPPLMRNFQKKNPHISFQILVSDSRGVVERIAGHEILMGIVGAKTANDQIEYLPFIEDELIVVSSSGPGPDSVSLKALSQMPMVVREEGSGTRKVAEKFLEGKGLHPEELNVSGIFGSTDAVKQAVKAGLGVAVVSRFSVIDELRFGILREIGVEDLKMRRMFYIVTHRKRSLPRLYDAFLTYLVSAEAQKFQD
jgi:DNA-binding transcriptional LysR family regulator